MDIGVVREIKADEYRVGLTPASVMELVGRGHRVCFEQGLGDSTGFADRDYLAAGGQPLSSAAQVYEQARLLVKVKEPQPSEYAFLQPHHILFTYLHLAADESLTDALLSRGCSCLGYETVSDGRGHLPLLAPMSEIAGRFSVQAAAYHLQSPQGGRGLLMAGAAGVEPAKVMILGGGVVGSNAARIANGMGAEVTILDNSPQRLRELDQQFNGAIKTVYSTSQAIEARLRTVDVVIGAVLIAGARSPRLISRQQLGLMQKGAVIVDIAIDQGGCVESSRPTSHHKPTYKEQEIIHYCVANVPGAVGCTASQALNNASLPYLLTLADQGLKRALLHDAGFAEGLNIYQGRLCCGPVAQAFGRSWQAPEELLLGA
jgi:alanine dehydrogenase